MNITKLTLRLLLCMSIFLVNGCKDEETPTPPEVNIDTDNDGINDDEDNSYFIIRNCVEWLLIECSTLFVFENLNTQT